MKTTIPLHTVPGILEKEGKGKKRERELTTKWLHPVLRNAGWDPALLEGKYRVHEELTGSAGRVDVALKIGRKIVACIEVKDPSVTIDAVSLKQACKYAASYYYPIEGVLDPILAVCTNGKSAFIMDPSLANPTDPISIKRMSLESANDLRTFEQLMSTASLDSSDGSLPVIACRRRVDVREYASNTHQQFKKEIFGIAAHLVKVGYKAQRAVELTVLVLLLAAARDNGIIPNTFILKCLEDSDWQLLANHFQKLFGDVFRVSHKERQDVWRSYDSTRNLNLRLDVVPVHFMGIIYQDMIRKYLDSKTSYYTPEDMINLVLDNVGLRRDDSILDPTCGSGAFLVTAIERILTPRLSDENEILKVFGNVVGIDRDPIAVQISKVSLLCQFMRCVGEEYRRTGKQLPRPNIKDPIDFFDWSGKEFSVIVGNPPWESIDALPQHRKKKLKTFSSYEDKNDQLCYIVEKCIQQHLSSGGRFGFVVKQQALLGNKYKQFCLFLDGRTRTIYDFGSMKRFDNYAQASILIGSTNEVRWKYIFVEPLEIALLKSKSSSFRFSDRFVATRGAQTGGANGVYLAYGRENPQDIFVKVYPKVLQLGGPPRVFEHMAYFLQGVPQRFRDWMDVNEEFKRVLENRKDVLDSRCEKHPEGRDPYAWRRNSAQNKLGNNILITERNLTPGLDRLPIHISSQEDSLPMDNQTVIGSLTDSKEDLLLLGALMLSRYFVPLARNCRLIPRRAGGIFLNPKTLTERLILPEIKTEDRTAIFKIMKRLGKRVATEHDLEEIDSVFQRYFIMSKQTDEEGHYSRQPISQFLQPELESEGEEEAA